MSETITRKNILFIGPIPPPITGQSLACQVFIEALREKHNVVLIDINKSDFASGGLVWNRVKEVNAIVKRIRRELHLADAVYFTIAESLLGNIKDLLIYTVCWRLLPRTVIHLHGGAGMERILHGPSGLMRRLNAFFLQRMAAVIVLGGRLRSIYDGVVPANKLRVVANFAESLCQAPAEVMAGKSDGSGPLQVLYLSNLIEEKGYLILRDAVKAIEGERPGSIQLHYAGGFVTINEKSAFLDSIAQSPFITYHGVVRGADKQSLLFQSHILALPTWYPFEGQPICILEGYAAGCAILTTDHSGIYDIFIPGENGWATCKESTQSVRAALIACLEDRAAVAEAGKRNAALAKERFTTSRYNDELITIMNEALGVS